MPRPWTCRVHGPSAPTRWRPCGRQVDGTPRRARVCSLCVPARGPCLRGKDECPRCGGRVTVRVGGGRNGQRRYRRCVLCRRVEQARYRARTGQEIDGFPCAFSENAEALSAALGRELSPPARVSLAGADWRTELFGKRARAALAENHK